MDNTSSIREIAETERALLAREAEDRAANRIGRATSIGAADAAQSDLKYALKRIDALTDAQLIEKANARASK